MEAVRKYLPWVLSVLLAIFFVAFGLNKFLGFMEGDTGYIFQQAGALFGLGDFFSGVVIYIVGIAEIVAGVLLLLPNTQKWGAFLGLLIVLGALFFHLFSPLGTDVKMSPDASQGDGGGLFIMAIIVFVLSGVVFLIRRNHRNPTAAT